jgi:hypothetical protein
MPIARPARRLATALAAGTVTVCLLAGCAGARDGAASSATPGATDASSSAPSGSASATPTGTPTAIPSPIPVTLTQAQVWTAQQVYSFNPNFATDPGYKAASGSVAAQLVGLHGVSYGWIDETSNDTIEVAVAHPNPASIADYEGAVAGSAQQVPIDGAPSGTLGFWSSTGGVGTLQVFTSNGYWVVIDSKTFLEPGDAYQIASDVMGNVK